MNTNQKIINLMEALSFAGIPFLLSRATDTGSPIITIDQCGMERRDDHIVRFFISDDDGSAESTSIRFRTFVRVSKFSDDIDWWKQGSTAPLPPDEDLSYRELEIKRTVNQLLVQYSLFIRRNKMDLTSEDRFIVASLLYQLCNSGRSHDISPRGGHHGGIAISEQAIRELAAKIAPSPDWPGIITPR